MNHPLPSFTFTIPDLIKARLQGDKWLMAPVKHEFAHYEERMPKDESEPDLAINFRRGLSGESAPRETACWSGHHRLAAWKISARPASPGGTDHEPLRPSRPTSDTPPLLLDLQGNFAAHFIVAKWVVEPALRFLAEERGMVMPHAAAVTDGEKAMLLAGRGGAGKTTWVLHWLSAGHDYLSDDFSLLREGRMFPYLTPLRLSAANLLVNRVLSRMARRDKAEIIFRAFLRRLVFGYAKFSFKTSITRILPEIRLSPPVPLAGAVWLEQKRVSDKETPPFGKTSAEKMAELMTETDQREMHGMENGLLRTLLPGCRLSSADEFWKRHQARLAASLQNLPCFIVPAGELPPPLALSSVPLLLQWLQSIA